MTILKATKKRRTVFIVISVLLILLAASVFIINLYFPDYILKPFIKTKTASDFNVRTIHSSVDFNSNSVDDYSDFVLGARKDAENMPTYDATFYVRGGYPPDNIGVCSDTVWRAFKKAGYSLKDMVDNDIRENPESYTNIEKPDKNIDFRRVKNLKVYFSSYAQSLTTDYKKIEEWQAGDIVIFKSGKNSLHIGIVSDKRNSRGVPLLIHNNGNKINRENDFIEGKTVDSHFRFDASEINKEKLIAWHE